MDLDDVHWILPLAGRVGDEWRERPGSAGLSELLGRFVDDPAAEARSGVAGGPGRCVGPEDIVHMAVVALSPVRGAAGDVREVVRRRVEDHGTSIYINKVAVEETVGLQPQQSATVRGSEDRRQVTGVSPVIDGGRIEVAPGRPEGNSIGVAHHGITGSY